MLSRRDATAPTAYPLRGIDVSHHQGAIDWEGVASGRIAFAYIKASEGADFEDKRFQTNWQGATRAGLPHGAYHYFTFCQDGAAQAQNFLRAAPRDPAALRPAADIELVGNCRT